MSGFSKKLLHWHKYFNQRQMPWKGEKNPYKIWLSEVILQQTRVEQGWNYYEKFIQRYPAICDLANAEDADVFKLWEGLGYYNRCKNLLFTARFICNELNGIFPKNYEEVLALKGVGNYTASAICSFAYNQPYAVVDGNVFRVLSRIYGVEKAIDSTEGKNIFTQLAQENLDKKEAALYNQAIMDFGATVCKPANPQCATCVMKEICVAHNNGLVNQLPVKEKVLTKKTRNFTWFVLSVKNEIFIHKRTHNDIWQNLNEFYLLETDEKNNWNNEKVSEFVNNQFSINPLSINISKEFTQQLTHQKIKAVFIEVKLKTKPSSLKSGEWITKNNIPFFAFPKIVNDYLSM
ncbi:A/G-specific adenine glycosylase [Arachidicoccus ginsenosidimutans]|uniref:A/G-specific adenine glycosylase n=1 Tax=Arachidicoccus sp. BS20 TaxID=1850526 RepID=UPI0007F04C5F|nr:A/G-specific adenine glycosylase [Arachidicoccus sp. BS20]ANI88021.1 A/G-specific adenine glycosylase [Arachidicoccus sp. BS20]